ncbi:MAG TPA: acyl carrier protein [Clostridiales bacterium]|nr:acyl carrier protein [Clostridiales bacterium]HBE13786.1 acyl carrier protein [Clostridiales bacterium]HCG35813.1 acyl carrier protein [Clostridiales bacterium]
MLERIAKIFKEYKADDDLIITEDTTFSDLALDSLDTVELIMNLEDEFGVTIEMNPSIQSIKDLMTILEKTQ